MLKPTIQEKKNQTSDRKLVAANGTSIITYGNRIVHLQFDNNEMFCWTFVVANVANNIIGMDFIKYFSLSLDILGNSILYKHLNPITTLVNKMVCKSDAPRTFSVVNEFQELLTTYSELTRPFSGKSLSNDSNKVSHKIVVNGYPCSARARPLFPEKLQCAQKEINDLIEAEIVRRSDFPFESPMHMVPKITANGGTYRLCKDYRQLDKMTVKYSYSIPNAQSLFHKLAGSTIFSKIDLIKAYHQIPLDPDSILLAAINYSVWSFRISIHAIWFGQCKFNLQRFIDHVLQGMNNVIAYVDDLIIFSLSFEEHKMHLAQLFQRLSQFNIVINQTKSQFDLKKINFLGHLVTPDGILPLPERVEVVQKYTKLRPANYKLI